METLPALIEVEEALAVSVHIGDSLVLTADPTTGSIRVCADADTDVSMDAEDFDLIGELMLRAVGAV